MGKFIQQGLQYFADGFRADPEFCEGIAFYRQTIYLTRVSETLNNRLTCCGSDVVFDVARSITVA